MKELLKALVARARQVPGLGDVRIYRNQLKHLTKENSMLFPLVLIELDRIDYVTRPLRHQDATMVVRLYVVGNSLTQGETDDALADYDIYDLKELVNQYFYGFSSDYFSPLERIHEETDTLFTNLYTYKIEYQTRFEEYVEPVAAQTVSLTGIEVDYDLDIDNVELRTGNNQGYDFTAGPHGHID